MMLMLLQSHLETSGVSSLKENLFIYLWFEGELVTAFFRCIPRSGCLKDKSAFLNT